MLHSVQVEFLFLLLLVVVFAALAQRVKIPSSIVLVIAGLAISFVPRVPRIRLDPNLVFLIFLPPLLYAAAWNTSWREFKRNLVSISMLAVGLVAFTVLGVALFADRLMTGLDFKSGFLLGAVVATTDAIAATSIARAVELPSRITDVLEGESLLNDATGLLALEFGLTMLLRGETPTVGGGLLRLLWLMGGGVAVGLVIGVVTVWVEKLVDDGPIEMTLSLIVPYGAYLAGEAVHASGVLAVVACGLLVARHSGSIFSPRARVQIVGAWGALDFVLNGVVFVLIGLQLPYVLDGIRDYGTGTLVKYGLGFSVLLIVLRLAWMFPASWVAFWIRTRILKQDLKWAGAKQTFVVGWTGMRGVIALAAAISIPETLGDGTRFVQRDLIVFLTFVVILVTLVLQGLTLPPLIRALGLAGVKGSDEEELEARRSLLGEAVAYLETGAAQEEDEAVKHGYKDLLHRYRHQLEVVCDECHGTAQQSQEAVEKYERVGEIALGAVQAERRALIRLSHEGKAGDEVVRKLERELDLVEIKLGG